LLLFLLLIRKAVNVIAACHYFNLGMKNLYSRKQDA